MHLNNMHRVTTPALCLALLACQVVPAERDDSVSVSGNGYRQELEQMLAGGAAARNRGDLDAFVSGYHTDSARTTYVGSRGLQHGHTEIREAYAADSSGAWKIVHDHSS